DVTVGPVVRLWRYARRLHELPEPDLLREALSLVDYRLIRLDASRRTVRLAKPGMRIDLGGIAKGYAADEAVKVLRAHGIAAALVDAGGDMALGDPPPDRSGWRIGVAPHRDGAPRRFLVVARAGVATSGDAYQHVTIGGRRYSHIVDPRTGLGLTDRSAVTIVASDGMTADALASAVSVLGPERGLALIEATPGAAGFIVRAPEGKEETRASKRWEEIPADPAEPEGP
ncbi:MAG: FAD:protein FMN transferase, partial [Planctomycetes bacterium]|nr:FAD:protein FMN transferase [Planctomycetota bacterium]